jgi:hypothetical protein
MTLEDFRIVAASLTAEDPHAHAALEDVMKQLNCVVRPDAAVTAPEANLGEGYNEMEEGDAHCFWWPVGTYHTVFYLKTNCSFVGAGIACQMRIDQSKHPQSQPTRLFDFVHSRPRCLTRHARKHPLFLESCHQAQTSPNSTLSP